MFINYVLRIVIEQLLSESFVLTFDTIGTSKWCEIIEMENDWKTICDKEKPFRRKNKDNQLIEK